MGKLTVAAAEKLKVRGITEKGKGKRKRQGGNKRTRLEYHDGDGLYLIVQKSGHKSWALKYKRNGVSAKLTLGPYNAKGSPDGTPKVNDPLSLAEARTLATSIKLQKNRGVDPIAEKKKVPFAQIDKDKLAFPVVAREYVERWLRDTKKYWGWDRTAGTLGLLYEANEFKAIIPRSLCAKWVDRPVSEITRTELKRTINDAGSHGVPGRERSNIGYSNSRERRMASALGGLFKWCAANGNKLEANPMTGIEKPEPAVERDRVLTDDELKKVWFVVESDKFDRPVKQGWQRWRYRDIIRLLILTGQRIGDVSGMKWTEVDGATWVIPRGRYKTKKNHVVHLTSAARAIIEARPREIDGKPIAHVFPGNNRTKPKPISGFGKAKARLDKLTGPILDEEGDNWRFHDLRRTVATGLQKLGVPLPVTEAVLGHVSGSRSGIVGIYQRHDYAKEKQAALEKWGRRVDAIISGRVDKKVIEFARDSA